MSDNYRKDPEAIARLTPLVTIVILASGNVLGTLGA